MEAVEFCRHLINFLAEFDESIPPLGLYSCDDLPAAKKAHPYRYGNHSYHQEWNLGLKPRLDRIGCLSLGDPYEDRVSFAIPGVGQAILKLAKISKIKVRKFGSHYRVDHSVGFRDRWDRLRLDRDLSDLWKPSSLADRSVKLRALLFLGFDKSADPFRKEMVGLRESVPWDDRDVLHETNSFEDSRSYAVVFVCS